MSGGGEHALDIQIHHGPDGREYVDRANAARAAGVKPATISTWEARGRLTRVPGTPPRQPLYALEDVIEAEYQARMNAARTAGTTTRAVRHLCDAA
ncbi:hypothetical protein NE236_41430 [Actinoallomurus purpureus]|uniref:hypothetical protein n=1 Tax=Actinoallomurus purpureus TaxID=478114 RepID=UPI0020921952|nr:hypothetical protein [Actinoallomurus purpureus]MCO6011432.1 hypothetical protein [Actinoallomurus purpureus]